MMMSKREHLAVFLFIIFASCVSKVIITAMASPTLAFQIKTTWNNETIPEDLSVKWSLKLDQDLHIHVRSPFYDDPKLPDWSRKPGTFDKLYDYEVVELFLLNDQQEHYLEIELSPRGQFLLLELKGYRNVVRKPIELKSYHSKIHGDHWSGEAVVHQSDLPTNINKFNAYAIYGSGENRTYLAMFPAPQNDPNYTEPDFHRLELFQPIDLFQKPQCSA